MNRTPATSRPNLQLALGTVSFAVCFAAWGLISAFAPRFRETFHLSSTGTAFLVVVPVLLGALARVPMGMLVDLFGGRPVFALLMFVVAVPAALVPLSFWDWRVRPSPSAWDSSPAGTRRNDKAARLAFTALAISGNQPRSSSDPCWPQPSGGRGCSKGAR